MKGVFVIAVLCAIKSLVSSVPTGEVAEIVTASNLFVAPIYRQVAKEHVDENVIVSPFSIGAILTMTLLGAKGKTHQELQQTLRLSNDPEKVKMQSQAILPWLKRQGSGGYSLNIGTKMYAKADFPVNAEYKNMAVSTFQSDVELVDFKKNAEAADKMNEWVKQATNDQIHNIINPSELDSQTVMVLLNAIHFKADWQNPFKLSHTSNSNFYNFGKQPVPVQMMQSDHKSVYRYCESSELNAKLLELNLQGGEASMVFVLPNERTGIANVENQIEKLEQIPKFTRERVLVSLPRFKTESEIEFVEILKNMGVNDLFDEKSADLSGIGGTKGDIFTSKIVQKASIDVNENGIEAAAATLQIIAVPVSAEINPPKPKIFNADHPFIYYIKVKGVVVFVGKLVKV